MNELVSVAAPTIPRVFTALAQWLGCMSFILVCQKNRRLHGIRFFAVAVIGLLLLGTELELTADLPVVFWVPAMLGSVFLIFILIWCLCDINLIDVGRATVVVFLFSEFVASLAWQLYYYYANNINTHSTLLAESAIILGTFCALALLFVCLIFRILPGGAFEEGTKSELLVSVIIGLAAFIISNLSFVVENSPITSSVVADIYTIRTLVDLGGFSILIAYEFQHRELKARYELDAIKNVLEAQYSQYLQSKESIDLINTKYHDLKHQIAALRAAPDVAVRSEWLDAMESDIAVYEAQNKTGNAVLDTILTAKSLFCQNNGISFTCVADGSLLGFMRPMDISAIFGNALDNAIEAVLNCSDPEKRLIHCSVSAEKSFVLIRVENYFEGALQFTGDMPATTKHDSRYHGFGVKSIRYAAERYKGTLSITADTNWFDLKVLIPVP